MHSDPLHAAASLLRQAADLLTRAAQAAQGESMDARRTYIGSEPHKLTARLLAQRRLAEWLEGHGCENFGVRRPDYRHPQYTTRWVLTTVHVLVYERTRADAPHARALWGEPIAKIPLLDVLDYFGWLHQEVGRRPAIAWPHPVDLPAKAEEIAAVASVMRACRATGPGYRKKIVWDE